MNNNNAYFLLFPRTLYVHVTAFLCTFCFSAADISISGDKPS